MGHHFKIYLLLPASHWVSVFSLLSWQTPSEPADAVASFATVGSNAASMKNVYFMHLAQLHILGNYKFFSECLMWATDICIKANPFLV